MSDKPNPLEPADVVKLVVALNRALITPFDRNDWHSWSGAMGAAHLVQMHPDDEAYFAKKLGFGHAAPGYVTCVLDEGGVTFNINSPVNMYAWQVGVKLELDRFAYDPSTPEAYWEADKPRGGGSGYGSVTDRVIAGLPQAARAMLMACPEEARDHALRGYLQSAEAQAPLTTRPVPLTEDYPLAGLIDG